MVTIHNNPENVVLPAKVAQLQFQLADVDTQDASPFFAPTFDLIEEARAAGQGIHRSYTGRNIAVLEGWMCKGQSLWNLGV